MICTDTSVLIPVFIREPMNGRGRHRLARNIGEFLAISE
jgi:hypothetical protein